MKLFLCVFGFLGFTVVQAQCYQDYILEHKDNHSVLYIGELNGTTYYAEVFSFNGGSGTSLNYILLRKDNLPITEYDFCFREEGDFGMDNVSALKDTLLTKEYLLSDIASISQVLSAGKNFATLDNPETTFYFKRGFLYVEYIEGSCISDCPNYHVTEKYKMKEGRFEMVRRRVKGI